MAYASRGSNGNRAAAGIAVALIQGAAIYALVTGLAVHFIPPEEQPRTEGAQMRLPPPPPLPDKPKEKKAQPPIAERPLDRLPPPPLPTLPGNPGLGKAGEGTTGGELGGTGDGGGVTEIPRDPPPSFTPSLARPRNNPANWATPGDYPASDLRSGNQGTTRFRLSIGADGSVLGCEIVASSGFAGLDAATCRNVSKRARLNPATDGYGAKVAGSYTGAIRWQIPEN